jgi:hypothetical protein
METQEFDGNSTIQGVKNNGVKEEPELQCISPCVF